MIDDIAIDFFISENFVSIKNVRRKCNSMVDLLKFTSNKKILCKVLAIGYNQFYSQTISF